MNNNNQWSNSLNQKTNMPEGTGGLNKFTHRIIDELERLGEFENYHFEFDKIHLWPLVRQNVTWNAYVKVEGLKYDSTFTCPSVENTQRTIDLEKLNRDEIHNRLENLSAKDVLIFSNSHQRHSLNGSLSNKHEKIFGDIGLKTLLIEDSHCDVSSDYGLWHELVFQYARIESKNVSLSAKDAETIDSFIHKIKVVWKNLVTDRQLNSMRKKLAVIATRLPGWKVIYKMIWERTRPKLVVIDKANYGTRAYQVKWFKGWGTRVADVQHGLLNGRLPTFTQEQQMQKMSWFNEYFADDYLVWSDYWAEKYTGLGQAHVIGNVEVAHVIDALEYNPSYVLFCLSGYDLEYSLEYLRLFVLKHPDSQIKLRLHKRLSSMATDIVDTLGRNIEIADTSCSVFDDLKNAKLVVSDISTVLFDATVFSIPTFLLMRFEWKDLGDLDIFHKLPNASHLLTNSVEIENKPSVGSLKYFHLDYKTATQKYWGEIFSSLES